jgi:heme A synthase
MVKRRGSKLAIGLNHAAALFVVLQIGVGVSAVVQTLPTGLRVLHLGFATLIWWSAVAQWVLALPGRTR